MKPERYHLNASSDMDKVLATRPGVTVVENLPKASASPAVQARIGEAKERLRQAKPPPGWRQEK